MLPSVSVCQEHVTGRCDQVHAGRPGPAQEAGLADGAENSRRAWEASGAGTAALQVTKGMSSLGETVVAQRLACGLYQIVMVSPSSVLSKEWELR